MEDIREIFEHKIKIEPKVMSIESLFNNTERVESTNYKPSYQRNYVWDDEKATYFIESILLGTEIPPLIYFRNGDSLEVIDGRQRYETIIRFITNEFKLKKNGLQKLENIGIANKSFKDLGTDLQDVFWYTKLRLIEFSFHSKKDIDEEMEEVVKKEIFKRYNSGITPLKAAEIAKAAYFDDDLNSFIKTKLQNDKILYRDISSLLHFEKTNDEIILKKIRQLLVQHQIPISYYAIKKDIIISKYYDFLFANINETNILLSFNKFIEKINLLLKIKKSFPNKASQYNRLITECLFWVFSILEEEEVGLSTISKEIIDRLVIYILDNISAFTMTRSSFAKELQNRYTVISHFFSTQFDVDFSLYLLYNQEFKQKNQEINPRDEKRISFDELRINKPEPSSTAIVDICRQMERQRFLIRPPYQRNEVINKKKSSSIIESILLGIKLPPIFVYKRKDEISEVLDGQQRLLSILGFIQKPYLDENNKIRHSNKDGFSLRLKNSILKNLHGKKFEQLTTEQKNKIRNFDLWIIEINYRNNTNFEPIDLFIRLNNKPYPIKEDTFEMWNSYISRDTIDTIKSIHKNHNTWFYIRKNNSRMEDENIYTTLIYFQFGWNQSKKPDSYSPKELDIYKVVNKINFRVKSKNEITKILEDTDLKESFIEVANEFEFNFIRKLKALLTDDSDASLITLNKNLDEIFLVENGRRTQQAFYALWYFLYDIPSQSIVENKSAIRVGLKTLFAAMAEVESKPAFDLKVAKFKSKYRLISFNEIQNIALLNQVVNLTQGVVINNFVKITTQNSKSVLPYLKRGELINYRVNEEDIAYVDSSEKIATRDLVDVKFKILIKRNFLSSIRLSTAYYEGKLAFNPDTIGVVVTRVGFLPKYLLSIISSRLTFSRCFTDRQQNSVEELRPLTINELKNIQIPVVSLRTQEAFALVVDYILTKDQSKQSLLFYERILDALVYELFFPSELQTAGIKILEYIQTLPILSASTAIERSEQVRLKFQELSNPTHQMSASLLKLLNVAEVQQAEEVF